MKRFRWQPFLAQLALLAIALAAISARAQQAGPHIAYVYPAGGRQGTTFEVTLGGQALTSVTAARFTGAGIQAALIEVKKPLTAKEAQELRDQAAPLQARLQATRGRNAGQRGAGGRGAGLAGGLRGAGAQRGVNGANRGNGRNAAGREAVRIAMARGTAPTTLTTPLSARELQRLDEIREKLATLQKRQANPALADTVRLRVTLAPDAEPGRREVRLIAPQGLTNPLAFEVGQLPELSQPPARGYNPRNPNASPQNPQNQNPNPLPPEPPTRVSLPCVANGQIMPGAVNRYRFAARRGTRLVAALQARDLIPYLADGVPGWFQATLTLCDAQGRELAYDDDFRNSPDPVLACQIPRDGDYVIEIKDAIYRGREDFVYRLTLGEVPYVTGIFPLGGPAGAQTAVEMAGWNLPAARLAATPRTPGVYLLSESSGGLLSNGVPFAVDTLPEIFEKENNDTPQRAQLVKPPVIVNGRIGRPGDPDCFRFEGRAGQTVVAEVTAHRLGSPLDSSLKLTDAAGRQLAFNDDREDKGAGLETHHADSLLTATLPASGTYTLRLADTQGKGGPEFAYRLRIGPPRPDFELRATPSGINVRGGASAPLTVTAIRRDGFAGEIALALKDAPAGYRLSGGKIPAGQDQVRLTLTVPPQPQPRPLAIQLEGHATIEGRQIVRQAVPAEDMMQAFFYHHLVPARELAVAVVGRVMPRNTIRLLSPAPVRIPAGGAARVLVGGAPMMLAEGEFELNGAPEGITLQGAAPVRGGTELVFKTDAAKVKPGQKGNLIVQILRKRPAEAARGKAAGQGRARLGTLPAIPFEIGAPHY